MLTRALAISAWCVLTAAAQEVQSGLSMPVTASFGAMDTHRFNFFSPTASPTAENFRLMFYPTLRLGKHWFAYAAIQVRRMPYFYYDAYLPGRDVQTDVVQGYLGYAMHSGPATIVFKAGQMVTAFGSFPLRYDDAQNPLMDQPLAYITEIPVRSDQVSCGTTDLLHQYYGSVASSCGGEAGRGPGLTAVSLYGMPGAQAEFSMHRIDGRVQMTSTSPAYTEGWTEISTQYLQWTAGGGFTISQGFRVGGSIFRGPYLDSEIAAWLPSGTTVRSFPATGHGMDVQWARGRFSTTGELQNFRFDAPNYVVPPRILTGYAEVKARLTPRFFGAVREGFLKAESVLDTQGVSASQFAPTMQSAEFGIGYWLHPHLLAKMSYEVLHTAGSTSSKSNVVGIQLVATFNQLQWGWK